MNTDKNLDKWVQLAKRDIRNKEFFNAFQMLSGIISRAIREDLSYYALDIVKNFSPIFISSNINDLSCELYILVCKALKEPNNTLSEWIKVIIEAFNIINDHKLESCRLKLRTAIIETTNMQNITSITILENITLAHDHISNKTFFDIYYCSAGLFLKMKNYEKTFLSLHRLYEEKTEFNNNIKLLTYLTLSELIAYEIDGCGEFLPLKKHLKFNSTSEGKAYSEIANAAFNALNENDYSIFIKTLKKFDVEQLYAGDILLKMLIEEIKSLLGHSGSRGTGLFSFL